MNTTKLRDDLPATHPANIVRELLHLPAAADHHSQSITARAIATLERRAPETILAARDAGVEIEYLGVSPLFRDPRFYQGEAETDWVLAPADPRDRAIAPRREGRELTRLAEVGIEIPLLYEAHEVDQGETGELREAAAEGRRELTAAQTSELVGPVPPPADSVALAERLAHRSTQVAHAARRTLQVAGAAAVAVVTVPAAAVGTALASAATLDPIIIGAMPAYSERPGAPAGWYALARWDW